MARRVFPRKDQRHRVVAAEILTRHAVRMGKAVRLPVPIDLIIEKTYGLEVVWEVRGRDLHVLRAGCTKPSGRRPGRERAYGEVPAHRPELVLL